MKKIIALKGRGERGKTTTIGMLHELLVKSNKFVLIQTTFIELGKDFRAVFKYDSITIGITSQGDTDDYVTAALKELIDEKKVNICICAARTFGGTHEAVERYKEYEHEYIDKTYGTEGDEVRNRKINEDDAEKLLHIIENILNA